MHSLIKVLKMLIDFDEDTPEKEYGLSPLLTFSSEQLSPFSLHSLDPYLPTLGCSIKGIS